MTTLIRISLLTILFIPAVLVAQNQERTFAIDSLKYGPGKVYSNPDRVAEFPGGYSRMNEFFATYFDPYAESPGAMSLEGEKEGAVEALFIVETSGKVKYVEITRSFTNTYDEQMESTLRRMPKWTPAMVNGVPVRSFSTYRYSLKFYMR